MAIAAIINNTTGIPIAKPSVAGFTPDFLLFFGLELSAPEPAGVPVGPVVGAELVLDVELAFVVVGPETDVLVWDDVGDLVEVRFDVDFVISGSIVATIVAAGSWNTALSSL